MKQYRLSVRFRFPADTESADPGGEVVKVLRGNYRSMEAIERKKLLYGPEPWRAYKPYHKGTDAACCNGQECGCGGKTLAEETAERRNGFRGEVVGFEVHEREVSRWSKVPS